MSEINSLEILAEIQSLVSDHLQLVSYKWLSRKFLVSSNAAKRLLQDFVESHEDELEVIYSVAGWLKEAPATYHIKLVPKTKLAEAKHDFDGNCSVQVYSVQSCIPKDPATIWNTEFVQTEGLFMQPSTDHNCLRDNRFSGVSNSFVKLSAESETLAVTALKAKGAGGSSTYQTSSIPLPQKKLPQSSPKLGLQSSDLASKAETDKFAGRDLHKEVAKDKVPPPSNKKGHSDKSPAGGGSLANLWGRASSMPKSSKVDKDAAENNGVPDSADAQITAIEKLEAVSSDDDEPDVNFRRTSNGDGGKKRRVVLDDSDEDDYGDAVNLGSPDPPPKGKSFVEELKQKNETRITKNSLLEDEQEKSEPIKIEEKVTGSEPNNPFMKDFAALDQGKNVKMASLEEKEIPTRAPNVGISKKNKATEPPPGSPKRKKVLKTRIDERGREVTEVVWEGKEEDVKHGNTGKNPGAEPVKIENHAPTNPIHRAATTKKSPATGNTAPAQAAGRAAGKKGASAKDPKQGNILSFFKKKT